jgi:predicted dehydrogenase
MIRIAVIGCGQWGANYIRVLRELKGVKLVSVCDENSKLTSRYRRLGISISTKASLVFRNPHIDAVIIVTPARTHASLLAQAIRSDKHILVEKPFVCRTQEAEKIIQIAKQHASKVLMVAHTFLYNPAVEVLKKEVQLKRFGKVRYLYSSRTNLGPIRSDVNAIWDLAPHDIAIFTYLMGALPKRVRATGGDYLKSGVQDVGFITLEYAKGVLGHIHVSWLDPNKVRRVTVVGERKMALFNDIDTRHPIRTYDKRVMKKEYERPYHDFDDFRLLIQDGECTTPSVKQEEPLKREVVHFLDCIRYKQTPLTHAQHGKDVCRILELIDRSIKKKGAPQAL